MKRVLGHCLAGLTLMSGGIALIAACQHNDSSLFVYDVLYPTPVSQGQQCQFTADPNQPVLSVGSLDLGFSSTYYAHFLVGNQLVEQASSQNLKTETSIINIEGALVQVTDAAGNQLDNFKTLAAGTVLPSTGTLPGYAAIGATIASQTAVSALVKSEQTNLAHGGTTTLVTYVKFYGHTLGGTYIESNNFEFPIVIGMTSAQGGGFLVNFSQSEAAQCNGVQLTGLNCLAPSSTAMSLPVPCTLGQDTPIDCSQCQAFPVCQGAYTGPSPCLSDGGAG
jgi:hypothetical protein